MKNIAWKAAVAVSVVALPTSMYWIGHQTAEVTDDAARNSTALAYICATTTVLDELVVAAADQISQNFENGTYVRLLRQKIITRENVDAARATLSKYRAAHELLLANAACDDLS